MPDENATTTFEAKVKLRPVDQCQIGGLVGYGFLLVLVVGVARVSELSVTDTGTTLAHMLIVGFFLFAAFHMGLVARIAKLEKRLAESESSRRS